MTNEEREDAINFFKEVAKREVGTYCKLAIEALEQPCDNNWRFYYNHGYAQAKRDSKKKTDWIPVSERLPERYKEVIVTDIETSDTYLSRYIGNRYWECDNGLFKDRIIAWMPLPKPYKAESEDKK